LFAGVLFDFDGTLVDTTDLVVKAFQHTLQPYLGREVKPEEVYPYFGMTLRDGLRAFQLENLEEAVAVYRKFSETYFDELVYLCPGVREGLEVLKEKGIKLGIVTSRVSKTTQYAIRLFGLEGFFSAVVTADDVDIYKPHPEPVLKGIELLKLEPDKIVMIGDSPHDILAAKAAGITSVAAGWSNIPRNKLLEAQPHVIVDSMDEFVDFCLSRG